MSRRNKLGAVSFEHWPNSEGEALSTVVLAALLEAGIRGHVWATTRRAGTGLGIDAVSAAQTLWDSCRLTPVIAACRGFTGQLLSHLQHGHTTGTRQIQASQNHRPLKIQRRQNPQILFKTPPRPWCVH